MHIRYPSSIWSQALSLSRIFPWILSPPFASQRDTHMQIDPPKLPPTPSLWILWFPESWASGTVPEPTCRLPGLTGIYLRLSCLDTQLTGLILLAGNPVLHSLAIIHIIPYAGIADTRALVLWSNSTSWP